ncbi:glycosyltransferase [Terriglobus sp. TAA 43]|uniref:glycosyltransferase n=1 Tax=Terriglobus sp. TAA 43 TaxID=278961 RepID=UPI00068BB17E|nr:nucleotide disphospho-sugar-binding domain-containing protein [Terriglobus sp. TAA 43]
MPNILVASTPLVGHVSQMLRVAEHLQERGYRVTVLTSEAFREDLEARSISFRPLAGRANYDWRNLKSLFTKEESLLEGFSGHIVHLKRIFGDCIPGQLSALEGALAEKQADAIVVDVLFMGVLPLLLRKEPRPPVISCGVIAPMWRDAGSSPFSGPDASVAGQARNIADGLRFDEAVLPGTRYIDEVLETLGVAIDGGFKMFDSMYRLPDRLLQLCTDDFEYPLLERRQNLRFVGPIIPNEQHAEGIVQVDKLDRTRPIIFVTQGTLANANLDQLVNPTLRALADESVHVIATAGGKDSDRIHKTDNSIVLGYAPYSSILAVADVFITNGGYSGVQQALSFGVPVIVAGTTEDKPYVASRVAWSGVGLDLKTSSPSEPTILSAVKEVLSTPRFHDRARVIGTTIRHTEALSTIADEVDGALGATHAQDNTREESID